MALKWKGTTSLSLSRVKICVIAFCVQWKRRSGVTVTRVMTSKLHQTCANLSRTTSERNHSCCGICWPIARKFRHLNPRLSEVFSSGLLHELCGVKPETFQKRFWRDANELFHYMYMIFKVSRKRKINPPQKYWKNRRVVVNIIVAQGGGREDSFAWKKTGY